MTAIARRDVVKGLGLASVAGLPLAAVLADPKLARAAAQGLDTVTITTKGGRTVSAAMAMPASAPTGSVVLIHEWWGLNDQIKAVAADFAGQGYAALAVDLMGGKVAGTPQEAQAQMQAVQADAALDTMEGWVAFLRSHQALAGKKLGTVGWCFGGGWSLNTSIATPVDATVIYYGSVKRNAEDLKSLKGPVLGHFATQDNFINKAMVDGFVAEMGKAGKSDLLTLHWYEANHAFANPTVGAYDQADAKLSWERTTAFLATNLA